MLSSMKISCSVSLVIVASSSGRLRKILTLYCGLSHFPSYALAFDVLTFASLDIEPADEEWTTIQGSCVRSPTHDRRRTWRVFDLRQARAGDEAEIVLEAIRDGTHLEGCGSYVRVNSLNLRIESASYSSLLLTCNALQLAGRPPRPAQNASKPLS